MWSYLGNKIFIKYARKFEFVLIQRLSELTSTAPHNLPVGCTYKYVFRRFSRSRLAELKSPVFYHQDTQSLAVCDHPRPVYTRMGASEALVFQLSAQRPPPFSSTRTPHPVRFRPPTARVHPTLFSLKGWVSPSARCSHHQPDLFTPRMPLPAHFRPPPAPIDPPHLVHTSFTTETRSRGVSKSRVPIFCAIPTPSTFSTAKTPPPAPFSTTPGRY